VAQDQHLVQTQLVSLRLARDEAQHALEQSREAGCDRSSPLKVGATTALNRQIDTRLQTLNHSVQNKPSSESVITKGKYKSKALIHTIEPEIADKQTQLAHAETLSTALSTQTESLAQSLQRQNKTCNQQQETQKRLLQEQREQRAFDKLEAQAQALQETHTYATKIILQSGLSGVCGLVVQLGRVEPRYQLALETAAGGVWGSS